MMCKMTSNVYIFPYLTNLYSVYVPDLIHLHLPSKTDVLYIDFFFFFNFDTGASHKFYSLGVTF